MAAEQTWDPERYARHARFVADLGMPVLALLDPREGERILDLGCGDGALTQKLVEIGCDVVGVDGSAAQVAAAVNIGIDARVMDGHELSFDREFDAVFSNAAMHWMKRPDEVIRSVKEALIPSGRFVAEMGGFGCVHTIETALIDGLAARGIIDTDISPWYFPTVEEYRIHLERQRFRVDYIELIPRPTPLPGDVSGWLETFAQAFTGRLPEPERAPYLDEIRDVLSTKLCDNEGQWTADYMRLRFAAYNSA